MKLPSELRQVTNYRSRVFLHALIDLNRNHGTRWTQTVSKSTSLSVMFWNGFVMLNKAYQLCPRSNVSNYVVQLHLCTLKALHRAALLSADIQVKQSYYTLRNGVCLSTLPTTKATKMSWPWFTFALSKHFFWIIVHFVCSRDVSTIFVSKHLQSCSGPRWPRQPNA